MKLFSKNLISWEKVGPNLMLTFEQTRKRWFRPPVVKIMQYHGSTTVWRTYPKFTRLPTHIENRLSDIHAAIRAKMLDDLEKK